MFGRQSQKRSRYEENRVMLSAFGRVCRNKLISSNRSGVGKVVVYGRKKVVKTQDEKNMTNEWAEEILRSLSSVTFCVWGQGSE